MSETDVVTDDLIGRLTIQAAQLIRAQKQATMGGDMVSVRVADPDALIWTLVKCNEHFASLRADLSRMREALEVAERFIVRCGAMYWADDAVQSAAADSYLRAIRAALSPAQKATTEKIT